MIKFKFHPTKYDNQVVSYGEFRGYFFYFRARQNKAIIQFARTRAQHLNRNILCEYELSKTEWPYTGWYPIWRCYLLIFYGCVKFLLNGNK